MALALSGTSNGSLNNLSLSGNTATIVDTGRAGGIVQVVTATTSTSVAVSTTTYTDTTLSASITPSSSSNKILVMVNQTGNAGRSARPIGFGIQLLRDSTIILKSAEDSTGPFDQYVNVSSSTATNIITRATINFLDSPSTTSSVTYKTQGRPYTTANSGAVTFNQNASPNNATSTILLMEVVA